MLTTNKYSIIIQFDTATGACLDALANFYEDTHSSVLRKLIESQFRFIFDSDICFDLAASAELKDFPMSPHFPIRLDEYTKVLLDELVVESGLSRSDVLRGMVITNCNLVLQDIKRVAY